MTTFLKYVADDLYQKLGGDFQNTTIIFPNKRASLFFNQYLWEKSNGKTMWAPKYTSISELFDSLSDEIVGDSIYLIVKLFEVYSQTTQCTKSLDQQYSLMEMMLSDFQDIDNNMVEPQMLFRNTSDWKSLTDLTFLEKEQIEAIEQFFGQNFNEDATDTTLKTRFKTLWNRLTDIYFTFQEVLLHPHEGEPMVYEGLMKRRIVEALQKKTGNSLRIANRLSSKTYVMAGFNVLNKTEMELFKYIKQNRDAKFYWDYDITYTKKNIASKIQSKYEAGQFILNNIQILGDEFHDKDIFNNMKTLKQITFIQSFTEDAQARYIGEWMRTHMKIDEPPQESAVILCNEDLLQPVLHSIDKVSALNITMGYSMTSTPAYSIIQALMELQIHGVAKNNAWKYKHVSAVLKHPFILKLVGKTCNQILSELSKNNIAFPTNRLFISNEILNKIFTPVSGKKLTKYLSELLSMIGNCYQNTLYNQDFTLLVYKESIFIAYTIINRIRTLQDAHPVLRVSDETLMRIILQQLKQTTIPFHGEPAIGLQVMGLLETRNLDFRNVIMLSVNEGQIPKNDKRTSLIPYTLRAAYGMTTIEREVSLYAYYYYRLLQRSESITLLYNTNTENGNKGEMSRFMLQTLAEAKELFAPGQVINQQALAATSETLPVATFTIKKDMRVMEKLHARFDEEHILSPSAINTYMKCPLKFYFNYVVRLRPDEGVSEDVDKPMFGTIFHYAIQKLYEPYQGKPLRYNVLHNIQEKSNEPLLIQKLYNSFAVNLFHLPEQDEKGNPINYSKEGSHRLALNGTQLINLHVIKEFMIHQIKADEHMAKQLENEGGYLEIMAQEHKYTARLQLRDGTRLLLGGYIDRIDLLHSPSGDRIRIVDYKTSSASQSASNVAELFDPNKCTSNYHITQTLYYCRVLTDETSVLKSYAVVPALMYCAKYDEKNFSGIVKLESPTSLSKSGKPQKTEIESFQADCADEFNRLLTQKIEEIFTPYEKDKTLGTFTQCADEQHCTYCDFLTFCRRHPKTL